MVLECAGSKLLANAPIIPMFQVGFHGGGGDVEGFLAFVADGDFVPRSGRGLSLHQGSPRRDATGGPRSSRPSASVG